MDILNEANWLLMLAFTTAFLTAYFFYLCIKTRALSCFGRIAIDSSSFCYLSFLGCVPALYLFTLLDSPRLFHISNGTFAVFLLLMSTLSAKVLMQWLAQGIRIPFKIEIDD